MIVQTYFNSARMILFAYGANVPEDRTFFYLAQCTCNMPHKMEHAGIAHGTTVGLSVPFIQPYYLSQVPVTPVNQAGAAILSTNP
jgi:hypothetical protein